MRRLALLGFCLFLAACAVTPDKSVTPTSVSGKAFGQPVALNAELIQRIHNTARHLGFDDSSYAFMAQAVPHPYEAQQVNKILSYRADASMQPASTIKLLTTAVALERLGPEHRGFTEMRTLALTDHQQLRGDLWLIAGADPEFGLSALWEMLVKLRSQSIRVIEGDLLVDRHRFKPSRFDQDLAPFDDAPEFPYNYIPDALSAHGGLQDILIRADRSATQVKLVPDLPGIVVDNQLLLNDAPCHRWSSSGWKVPQQRLESDGRTVIVLSGTFPRQCTQQAKLQLVDRNRLLEAQFRWLWTQLGGDWHGRLREVAEDEAARTSMTNNSATTLLVRREARPWGEWIRPLNKRSDNALTRLLFLEIGALAAGPNMKNVSSFDLADREIRTWLTKRSINPEGLVLDNGSGLSRIERVTARQMVSMLIKLSQEHRYHDLMMSLPVAGEDNTLKRRYTGSLANGSARLKTGSLWNVSAIAGVVYDRKQRPWMVSVMVNHPKASAAAPLITEIVDTIAAYDLD